MKLNKKDVEKFSLIILFWGTVLSNMYVFVRYKMSDPTFVGLTTFIGALMVGRKGLSYWKPERYQEVTYTHQEGDDYEI